MIYEYKCENCSEVSEFWMKMSDPHPTECPRCKTSGKLERLISLSSFALKGSGWYTSDYKRAPTANKDSSATAATTPPPVAATAATEAKATKATAD